MRVVAVLALAALLGCRPHSPRGLANVYIVYNFGCVRGCDEIAKGDWLQSVDGRFVANAEALDAIRLTDGSPHTLRLFARGSREAKDVEILALPRQDMLPLVDVPPFWSVTATLLQRAPEWARRRMFGHASPIVQLASVEGDYVDGRGLLGGKRLMVYWSRTDRVEEAHAVVFMQVLQKAQSDLREAGVEIMFVHTPFLGSMQPRAHMTIADLFAWRDRWSVREAGSPLPPVPFWRHPRTAELDPAREVGMELHYRVIENLGESPAIVMLDERGIVRWHSEGVATPPADAEVQTPDQYTIIEAVEFALRDL